MKKLLLFAITGLASFTSVAQITVQSEDFTTYLGTAGSVPAGWTFSYNGNYTTTASSGTSGPNSYKFGVNNATITSPMFTMGDTLSFWVKGNGTDTLSALVALESADNISWDTVVKLRPLSTATAGQSYKHHILATSHYIRFVYIKSVGNAAFDDYRVIQNPPVVANITAEPQNTTDCVGSAVSFGITATGATSYQWEENTGTGFAALANGGVYSGVDEDTLMISDNSALDGYEYRCIAINAAGNDTSATALLTANPTVIPSITISGTTTLCEGDSIVGITMPVNGGPNASYEWSVVGIGPVSSDSVFIFPAGIITAGSYTVTCTLISDAACASPTTVTSSPVVITVNPNPATPVISQNVNELSTTSYTTYQWYFGTVALGTDSAQTAAADGIYTVVVTDANGCSATSDDYNFIVTGINTYMTAENVSIYPNPSKNGIFNYSVDANKAVVTVYNIIGKQISTAEITKGTHTLDLSTQANGSYFMSIKTDKEVITKKIIVSK